MTSQASESAAVADKPTGHQVAIQCAKLLVALAVLLVAVAGGGPIRPSTQQLATLHLGGVLASTLTDGHVQGRVSGAGATLTVPQATGRLVLHGPVPEGADGLDWGSPAVSVLHPPSTGALLVGALPSTRQQFTDHGFLTARTPTGPPAA